MSASRAARGSTPTAQLPVVVGAVLLAVAAVGVAYPLWWNHRSASTGRRLLQRALLASDPAHRARPVSCPRSASAPGSTPGVLQIPALGLEAPVLEGLTDNVLNVAVGHDSASPWPGAAGEAVLEAHDASYFAHLAALGVGATVIWSTRCSRSTFAVVRTSVSRPGAVVDPPAGGFGLALVTCWPTNALFWTSSRYLVETRLVRTVLGPQHLGRTPAAPAAPRVPAPAALAALGLGLAENSIELGTLHLAGSPALAWAEGPGPLAVEKAGLAAFVAARKTVAAHNATWWSAITVPGLHLPGSWPAFGRVDVTVAVNGRVPSAVTVASSSATARFTVRHGEIRLASLSS